MATTNNKAKNTTKVNKTEPKETKPTTVVIEEVKETVEEKVVVEKKREFRDSDLILCRSVWSGGLNVNCKSGSFYEFKEYGSECDIEYRDLVALIRKGSEHILLPRFIIVDDEFLADFPQIQKLYDSLYTTDDLVGILDLPIFQMETEIKKLPESMKDVLRNLIASEIASGRLDSIKKVRTLSEIFDSDFNLLSELFGK